MIGLKVAGEEVWLTVAAMWVWFTLDTMDRVAFASVVFVTAP